MEGAEDRPVEVTFFDICKIEDMDVGDKVTLECGGVVLKYKDCYTIIFDDYSNQFKDIDSIKEAFNID